MTTDPLPVQLARLLGWTDLTPHEAWDDDHLCRWWTGRPAPGEPACCVPDFDSWEDVGVLIERARAKGVYLRVGPLGSNGDLWCCEIVGYARPMLVAPTAAEAVGLAFVGALGKETQDNG